MKQQSKNTHQLFTMALLTVLFILTNSIVLDSRRSTSLAQTQENGSHGTVTPATIAAPTVLAIDPVNSAIIYAGTDSSGVFKSNDGGTSWSKIRLAASRITALAIDAANPNTLYAGTAPANDCYSSDYRLFKSTDGGNSWGTVGGSPNMNGCDAIYVLALAPSAPNVLYIAHFDGIGDTYSPLIRSDDGGATLSYLRGLPFTVLAVDPHDPNTVYGGTFDFSYFGFYGKDVRSGVFKSTDGGATTNLTGLTGHGISVLTTDAVNRGTLYAAKCRAYLSSSQSNSGLFKSVDGSANWFAINNGLTHLLDTDACIVSLVIDPASADILYAGTAGGGVFKSADGGANWTAFNEGLTNRKITTLAIAKGEPTILYAGTSAGLFKLINGNWVQLPPFGIPKISSASVRGKKLILQGENFAPDTTILLNGQEQKTKNDEANPQTALIGTKAGKKVKAGDKLQVRNSNGSLSAEFIFTGS